MTAQGATAPTQAERDDFRARFLLACYQKFETGQAWEKDGGLIAVGLALAKDLGLDDAEAHLAYRYLARRGLITTTQSGVGGRLTDEGQDVAERMLRQMEAAPDAPCRNIGFDTTKDLG
jgi:hypothetical protein